MSSCRCYFLVLASFLMINSTMCFQSCRFPLSGRAMPIHSSLRRNTVIQRVPYFASLFEVSEDMDEEEVASFKEIATEYLTNKFRDCRGDDCRELCTKAEVEQLLRSILPPVSKSELAEEVSLVMKNIKVDNDDIDVNEFIQSALDNSYWQQAGPLVVKELMFLDCLNAYYFEKRQLLDNDKYNLLKEQLTWEGSMVASMKGNEANFITAVAANRRGQSIMSDENYMKLKNQLLSEKSWVVARQADPLEKLGIQTFLGYLHRSLN